MRRKEKKKKKEGKEITSPGSSISPAVGMSRVLGVLQACKGGTILNRSCPTLKVSFSLSMQISYMQSVLVDLSGKGLEVFGGIGWS